MATEYADLTRELFDALLSLDDGYFVAEPEPGGEVEVVPLAKLRKKKKGEEDAANYTLSGEEPGEWV